MSRAKATEVTSPLSLFPFIGVLLATMGALLVVLMAVSRSARDSALRSVAAERAAAEKANQSADADENAAELQQISQYVARLSDARSQAQKQVDEDQHVLSHLEDHMLRLQDEMASLKAAAADLQSVDEKRYDDRRQAEREVARLHELINESRKTVKSLAEEIGSKPRSYAIIPYDGPNGTRRRPIYIECRKDEVILQPEGIKLVEKDFLPPLGAGNPLAAALRAAREYLVQAPDASQPNKEREPYPLILVRPDGILEYYKVREAIETWDSDFGFELVDSDSKVEFQPPNPELARVEHQAIELARVRQNVIASAAPRAFRARRSAVGDEIRLLGSSGNAGIDEMGGGPGAAGNVPRSSSGAGIPAGSTAFTGPLASVNGQLVNGRGKSDHGSAQSMRGMDSQSVAKSNGGNGSNGSYGGPATNTTGGNGGTKNAPGTSGGAATESGAEQVGPSPAGDQGTAIGTPGPVPGGGAATAVPHPTGGSMSGSNASDPMSAGGPMGNAQGIPSIGGASAMSGDSRSGTAASGLTNPTQAGVGTPTQPAIGSFQADPANRTLQAVSSSPERRADASRESDWALQGKSQSAVPIRRTIHVIVRGDRLSILPESSKSEVSRRDGHEVLLEGATAANLDDFVGAVQQHVGDWGTAGSGLYWRPVLLLNVAPDGQRRADDLARLLKNSGIEIRAVQTAANTAEGNARATR